MALEPLERRQGILLERTRLLETRKLETHNRELSESHPNSPAKQAYEMVMDIINFSNPDLYNP